MRVTGQEASEQWIQANEEQQASSEPLLRVSDPLHWHMSHYQALARELQYLAWSVSLASELLPLLVIQTLLLVSETLMQAGQPLLQ